MTVQEIIALIRRHVFAVTIVVLIAAGVGYAFKHAKPMYVETGTVVFAAPKSVTFPNPYESLSGNLTQTAGIMALLVMSPRGQQLARSAGGMASFDVELVNLYNLEYPNYSDPFVTVVATSASPAEVIRTFAVVTHLLEHELSMRQAEVGSPAVDRITAHVIGDTGVLPERGSSKRMLAGLLMLMVVAAFSVSNFLDRHAIRRAERGWLLGRFRREAINGKT